MNRMESFKVVLERIEDRENPRVLIDGASLQDPRVLIEERTEQIVTIRDNDERGVIITPPRGAALGGETITFTVVLTSEPTADIRVQLSVTEGFGDSITPPQLVFTPDNWNAPQTLTFHKGQQ